MPPVGRRDWEGMWAGVGDFFRSAGFIPFPGITRRRVGGV
jgi:hypothetical protein